MPELSPSRVNFVFTSIVPLEIRSIGELINAERGNFVFCHALHPQTGGTIGTGDRLSIIRPQ